jgi:pimeloyl-ACP methyl ester carboxylesterase
VRALVLCSAGARFALSDEQLDFARRVSEGKERRPFDPRAFSKQTKPETMRKAFMEGMKTDPRATYGDLQACRDWDDTARLGEIAAPTLVVHGADELDDVREQAEALSSSIPGAQLRTIPAAGHSLLLEAPEALGTEVGAFLAALPVGRAGGDS